MPVDQRAARWNTFAGWWSRVFLLLVLLLCAAALYTLAVSQWRGPWRDTWEAMPFIEKAITGQASWADYWEQYGFSHRPLISRWLWMADLRWFAGSNMLLLSVSLLMQLLILCVVGFFVRQDNAFSVLQKRIVLAGAVFCLLNITQVFNFLHTFDVQWFLVTGLVTLSLAFILQAEKLHRISFLCMGWLLVFLASLNNFSALVMWPVEIVLLMALRVSWRQTLVFALAFIAYLPLYFFHLSPDGDALSGSVLQSLPIQQWLSVGLVVLVKFPLWYLANPLSFQLASEGPLHAPLLVSWLAPGVVGVLLLMSLWHWWQGVFQYKKYSAVVWLGLSLMLFGYGVGAVTALGRGFFWDNVYALRYQNIVLLFWIGVTLWLSAAFRWRLVYTVLGSVLLLLFFASRTAWYHELLLKTGNRTRDAHLALVVGLENQLSAIQATVSRSHLGEHSDYTLKDEATFLREHHTGVYADPVWTSLPSLESLQASDVCAQNVSDSKLHGSDSSNGYARVTLSFRYPVSYKLVVWYDNDSTHPGLLIPSASDDWLARVQQTFLGFTEYAGFLTQLPQLKPEKVFARDGESWCKLLFENSYE